MTAASQASSWSKRKRAAARCTSGLNQNTQRIQDERGLQQFHQRVTYRVQGALLHEPTQQGLDGGYLPVLVPGELGDHFAGGFR